MDIIDTIFFTLRAIMGLILIFFIPGFAFTWAVYARNTDLSLIVRIALSCVLSIAIVMLSSLVLDFVLGVETTGQNVGIMLILISLFFIYIYILRLVFDRYGIIKLHQDT